MLGLQNPPIWVNKGTIGNKNEFLLYFVFIMHPICTRSAYLQENSRGQIRIHSTTEATKATVL